MKKFGKYQKGKKVEKKSKMRRIKHLGTTPKKWAYDEEKKLYLLYEGSGSYYLIIVRALLSSDLGRLHYGMLGDGTEYILWDENKTTLKRPAQAGTP